MTMTTTTRDVDGVTIVDIKGRLVLGEESAALRALVADLVGKGQKEDSVEFCRCQLHRQLGLGQSGQFLSQSADVRWRVKAAQPHEEGSRCDASYKTEYRFPDHGR